MDHNKAMNRIRATALISAGSACFLLTLGAIQEGRIREIPFDTVYSYNGQKGMKWIVPEEKEYGESLPLPGASNVFFVTGDEIKDAVIQTLMVLNHGYGVDDVALSRQRSNQFWLVAYLGTANIPSFTVKSIEIEKKTIRVRFSPPPQNVGSLPSITLSWYWAPLGTLNPGTYTLELWNEDRREISLMRKVTI